MFDNPAVVVAVAVFVVVVVAAELAFEFGIGVAQGRSTVLRLAPLEDRRDR